MGNDIVYVLLVKDYRHATFYVYGVCRTLEGAKKLRAHLIANDAYLEPYIEIDEEPLED